MTEAEHWEKVHSSKQVDGVSWWQEEASLWLDLLDGLAITHDDGFADLGSGSSLLVDALVAHGWQHVLAVDVAPSALERIRQRLGNRPEVTLVAADVRQLRIPDPVRVWHDRAVFHFLTDPADRLAYRGSLRRCLAPGGYAIVATFAPDGPESCSGLPVIRYSPAELVAELGFQTSDLVRVERRLHVTPWGSEQPFTVVIVQVPEAALPR